jgi:DNA processing protein
MMPDPSNTDSAAVDMDSRIRNRDAALRLSQVPGVGPRTYQHLLNHFGSPAGVLSAAPVELREVEGVGAKVAAEIALANENIDVAAQLEICASNGIEIIDRDSENYPQRLAEIYDPPSVLFVQGKLRPENSIAIAIVGSRHATNYGIMMAESLGRGMALAGFTVVSGLARGIDAAAHRGALQVGGLTMAVLGSGLLNLYPAEHANLASEIRNQGSVISEYLPFQAPKSGAFPQRNRIITGLSLGVVVVEAGERSGALISARLAGEQGREVFAVPGRANSRMSRGCHALIKDGAKLVESVDDILEELGPLATPAQIDSEQTIRHPAELQLTEQESLVLQQIDVEPTPIDLVVEKSGLPVARVLSTVSVLEIRRLIRRVSGNKLVRK